MIRTLTNVLKQDKEKFAVPRKVQDIILRASELSGLGLHCQNHHKQQKAQYAGL